MHALELAEVERRAGDLDKVRDRLLRVALTECELQGQSALDIGRTVAAPGW